MTHSSKHGIPPLIDYKNVTVMRGDRTVLDNINLLIRTSFFVWKVCEEKFGYVKEILRAKYGVFLDQ